MASATGPREAWGMCRNKGTTVEKISSSEGRTAGAGVDGASGSGASGGGGSGIAPPADGS